MRRNIGNTDQVIRLFLGILLLFGLYLNWFTYPLTILAGVAAFILTLTSVTLICPLYSLLGFSSCKVISEE